MQVAVIPVGWWKNTRMRPMLAKVGKAVIEAATAMEERLERDLEI